jgi:hypothetical protein
MVQAGFGPIRQIAWLVDDLTAGVERWSRFSGIGPWTVYRNVRLSATWRGVDAEIVIDVGLSYRDDVQIELIQPISRTPSPYQDSLGATLVGLHHVAWLSDDLERDKALAIARGLALTFEARNAASHVAYFESAAEPGLRFEFIQASPMMLEGFAAGVAASRGWDGGEPVIHIVDFAA